MKRRTEREGEGEREREGGRGRERERLSPQQQFETILRRIFIERERELSS